jgi:hypothetical protein
MSYEVLWVSEAEEELAAIWMDAEDRASITTASHLIDTVLRLAGCPPACSWRECRRR